MFSSIFAGIANFADPAIWLWLMGGTILGLVLGLIPGVGSLIGMALFLPFTFRLDPLQAMPFLVAMSAVGFTGGSITAVLLGVPGDAANVVTTFDGYPMAQRGEGARAVGAALTSSLVGGVMATGFAILMMFAIMPIVMNITSREMVFIILIGLSFICLLGKGDRMKSLISGCIGMLLSCVGLVSVTGEPRFTFDIPALFEGLTLIPVTLGLFAVPPMVELAMQGGSGTISHDDVGKITMRDTMKGVWDVLHHKFLCFKCAIIGYFFGVVPGVGANAAIFIAYGHARSVSPNGNNFGKGEIEGVIAPESCNNAKESGSWLTTLALGVPGSATGAMGLGALLMLGVMPGPAMLTEKLDLTTTLLLSVALANVLGFIFCFPFVSHIAKVAKVPGRILVPLVLVLIVTGSYAFRCMLEDLIILLVFSLIGILVRYFRYNAGSLLLGFLLGSIFESYLFISLQAEGLTFFMHPIPLFLMGCLILFLIWPVLRRIFGKGDVEC